MGLLKIVVCLVSAILFPLTVASPAVELVVYSAEFSLSSCSLAGSAGAAVQPEAEPDALVEVEVSGTSVLREDPGMLYNVLLSVAAVELAVHRPVVPWDTRLACQRTSTGKQEQPAVHTLQVVGKHQVEPQDKLEPGTTLADEELHTS